MGIAREQKNDNYLTPKKERISLADADKLLKQKKSVEK